MRPAIGAGVGRVARFGLVGILNTALGLTIIIGSKVIFDTPDLLANALGYGVGLVVSFALNRGWTFGHRGRVASSATRFVVVFVSAYALNLATVFGLRDLAGWNAYFAQVGGVFPYIVCFYLGSALYVFPRPENSSSAPRADRPDLPRHRRGGGYDQQSGTDF